MVLEKMGESRVQPELSKVADVNRMYSLFDVVKALLPPKLLIFTI